MSSINPALLLDLLAGHGLGVEYQPIVKVGSEQVIGYEALARFRCSTGELMPPDQVFRGLHESPLSLFQLEYRMKQIQIAMAPQNTALFLNIDQDAFEVFSGLRRHPMVELLQQRPDCVVEIIENCSISDAQLSSAMMVAFGAAGIPLALDDVGASQTLVSFEVMLGVTYLKLARDWILKAEQAGVMQLLEGLVHFAHHTGKKVILEGVETEAQLDFAKALQVDAVQGFIYRPRFIQRWADEPTDSWISQRFA